MISQYFHSSGEEEGPPRVVLQRKKSTNAFHELQRKMSQAVILTAEGVAYDTIRAHLNNSREEIYQGMLYTQGIFPAYKQRWNVSIIEIALGEATASFEAKRAIHHFQPDVILLISTVRGFQGMQPGDVVNATEVYAYAADKPGATLQTEPTIWHVNSNIEQQIRTEAKRLSWLQRIQGNVPAITPRVVLAPIASGEEEIEVASIQPQVFASEIGGYAILQAIQAIQGIDTLIVCGIEEMISGQSLPNEGGHSIAVEHASAFAFEMLAQLESKTPSQPAPQIMEKIEVFYSYVDADQELVNKLQQQLVMLKRAGLISEWHAGKITAGGNLHEHRQHLETAQLILLLISPDYIASEHHYSIEVKNALERDRAGDARIVPILLRPTNGLNYAGLDGLQTIPSNGKEISLTKDLDQTFKEVAHEIEEIVKELRSNG